VTFGILESTSTGTLAEYVVVPAANVFGIPGGLSFAEAARFRWCTKRPGG